MFDAQNITATDIDMMETVLLVAVAVISALVSVYAAWVTWRHNRKAVRPLAAISLCDYENLLAVELTNGGAGSFIPTEMRVVKLADLPDPLRRKVAPETNPDRLRRIRVKDLAPLRERGPDGAFKVKQVSSVIECAAHCDVPFWNDFVMDLKGRPVPPSHAVALLKLEMTRANSEEPKNAKLRDAVREALSSYVVFIAGVNIYDEPMSVTYRRLDWFGRVKGPRAYARDPTKM